MSFWCLVPFQRFLFLLSEYDGFSRRAQSSHQLSLSLWWRRRTWFTSCLTKKWAAYVLVFLAHVALVVEGAHLAAGFPCKVGPGTLRIFSGATYSTVCIYIACRLSFLAVSQLFRLHYLVTLSITCKCSFVNPFGSGPWFPVRPSKYGGWFQAKSYLQSLMTDRKRSSKSNTHNPQCKPAFLLSAREEIMGT